MLVGGRSPKLLFVVKVTTRSTPTERDLSGEWNLNGGQDGVIPREHLAVHATGEHPYQPEDKTSTVA
jgi:hypothetical protein